MVGVGHDTRPHRFRVAGGVSYPPQPHGHDRRAAGCCPYKVGCCTGLLAAHRYRQYPRSHNADESSTVLEGFAGPVPGSEGGLARRVAELLHHHFLLAPLLDSLIRTGGATLSLVLALLLAAMGLLEGQRHGGVGWLVAGGSFDVLLHWHFIQRQRDPSAS